MERRDRSKRVICDLKQQECSYSNRLTAIVEEIGSSDESDKRQVQHKWQENCGEVMTAKGNKVTNERYSY